LKTVTGGGCGRQAWQDRRFHWHRREQGWRNLLRTGCDKWNVIVSTKNGNGAAFEANVDDPENFPTEAREIICTGMRFPVSLAFNAAGDLFAPNRRGDVLPNGNP
jgi:hypothetical protein